MPAPVQPLYPALYLYPLNDSFIPKHISLIHNQRVKIGRQTNAKTAPGERNGYFDSKVLSRQHAEVWEDANKIFIKDVKSSNGTFINGDRLSPEGLESEPYELKSDDIVEFGIDIVGEDNKTIIHHKVAARVVCVFNEQDAEVAARAEQHQQQHAQQYQAASIQGTSTITAQPGPSTGNTNGAGSFNFAPGQQRRPQMAQQGLAGMGGMGGNMRPPGKSGLTFDHILSRLQGELQKSRETGAELHTLTGAMNEIHDTLGGNLPSNLPSYPSTLPPARPSQSQSESASALGSNSGSPEQASVVPSAALATSALVDLQTKLSETQSSLTSHVDKIRALEGVLVEQEAIKQEVRALRAMMETKRREIEDHEQNEREEFRDGFDEDDDEIARRDKIHHPGDDDNDDAKSVVTIVPHELESVEEEDEEQLSVGAQEQESYHAGSPQQTTESHHVDPYDDRQEELGQEDDVEERRKRNDELGRPRTPEPTNLGIRGGNRDPFSSLHHTSGFLERPSKLLASIRNTSPASFSQALSSVEVTGTAPAEEVFEQVLNQVGALMALTSSLEAQHAAAQSTISALENKVQALETIIRTTQTTVVAQTSPPASPVQPPAMLEDRERDQENLTAMVLEWKKSMEGQWSNVREDWDKERERLNFAREQWEDQVRCMDSGLERLASLQSVATALQLQQQEQREGKGQEHAALVNGDAIKHIGLPPSPRSLSSDSNRSRRRRSGGLRRGRSGQRSRNGSAEREGEIDTDTDTTLASEDNPLPIGKTVTPPTSPMAIADDDGEATVLGINSKSGAGKLATPESPVYKLPSLTTTIEPSEHDCATTKKHPGIRGKDMHIIHMQTAIGVLVLGVAAAAVIWRVKPES